MYTLLLTSAWASSLYVSDVESTLGMPCQPTCVLCHETLAGGGGTVTREVGQALMARGLTGGSNSAALEAALAQLETDAVDSDGDGVIDVDELVAGDDPNPGGVAFCDLLVPTYGCVGSVVPAGPSAGAALVAGLLLAGSVTRRR